MNKFIILVLKLLNLSIIFHTSADSNFDSIEAGKIDQDTSLRFSALYLPLGMVRLYILTVNIHRKNGVPLSFDSKLIFTINFNDIQKSIDLATISKRTEDYETEILSAVSATSLTQQEEFLKMRISENQNSMANILNKSGYHTTVMLAYAAVLAFAYTQYLEIETTKYLCILFTYLATITFFEIINLALFLKKSVEVRGIYRSTFNELKTSDKNYALAKSLYFDWQSTNNSLTYSVGLARNTEQSSIRVITLGLTILFLAILSPKKTNSAESYDAPLNYYIANIDTYKKGETP